MEFIKYDEDFGYDWHPISIGPEKKPYKSNVETPSSLREELKYKDTTIEFLNITINDLKKEIIRQKGLINEYMDENKSLVDDIEDLNEDKAKVFKVIRDLKKEIADLQKYKEYKKKYILLNRGVKLKDLGAYEKLKLEGKLDEKLKLPKEEWERELESIKTYFVGNKSQQQRPKIPSPKGELSCPQKIKRILTTMEELDQDNIVEMLDHEETRSRVLESLREMKARGEIIESELGYWRLK